ncbi:MAG: hypothetical protein RLZZ136_1371 [Pseudomonadota bacterium]|jgi:hypothetical protein
MDSITNSGRGFRRRILIEPAVGVVTAELEDDYHRMVVSLTHCDGVVSQVASEMKRAPWTTCPGAMLKLQQTFTGVPLATFVAQGDRPHNCTHLYDLAIFAAAHHADDAPVAYDIFVSDPVDAGRQAQLWRDGALLLDWVMEQDRFTMPAALAGLRITEIGGWIAEQDKAVQEAARILRWAAIVALGRQMDMPAHMSGEAFAQGNCFTFQPETAKQATRLPNADIDFSAPGMEPMADRTAMFRP